MNLFKSELTTEARPNGNSVAHLGYAERDGKLRLLVKCGTKLKDGPYQRDSLCSRCATSISPVLSSILCGYDWPTTTRYANRALGGACGSPSR